VLKNSSNGAINARNKLKIKRKTLAVKTSDFVARTPPIRKWGVFKEETEGTFRRKIQAALF